MRLKMGFKKTLTGIVAGAVVAGAVALGSAGCDLPGKNYFKGSVGEEHVDFYYDGLGSHVLRVRQQDGTVVTYVDFSRDHTVDKLEIENRDVKSEYIKDAAGTLVIEQAQRNFDLYLTKLQKEGIKILESSSK